MTRVVWSLENLTNGRNLLDITDQEAWDLVSVNTVKGEEHPNHFFQVEVAGINRHARGTILNRETVRSYIGEVCPVPMAPDFPFSKEALGIFTPAQSPYSIQVHLDGDPKPVTRLHGAMVPLTGGKEDRFQEFEEIRIPSIDGGEDAAAGWIAHPSYQGAIPRAANVRGIRVRTGNIQVGDEKVFDHLFEEDRFNRWCVGEIHIWCYRPGTTRMMEDSSSYKKALV